MPISGDHLVRAIVADAELRVCAVITTDTVTAAQQRHGLSAAATCALGRGLTLKDSCTVDSIVAQLKEKDYSAQTLIEAIVLSVPFRYQAGMPPQKEQPKP